MTSYEQHLATINELTQYEEEERSDDEGWAVDEEELGPGAALLLMVCGCSDEGKNTNKLKIKQ